MPTEIVGILKVHNPNSDPDLVELAKIYQHFSTNIKPKYYVEFLKTPQDISSSIDRFYRYKEGPYELNLGRDKDTFYIFSKGYRSRFILEKIIFFALLERGFARIHSGGIQNPISKEVTLIIGSGGVGKTTTTLSLVSEKNVLFIGDDVIIVDTSKNVYPIFRKINIYKYHMHLLPLDEQFKKKHWIREVKSKLINAGINIGQRIFKISYEVPRYSVGWIGEFEAKEVLRGIQYGTKGPLSKMIYLQKSDSLELIEITKDQIITSTINETIAEESWGHVDKFYGIANEIFELNPSIKMYEILSKAFPKKGAFILKIPRLNKSNKHEAINKVAQIVLGDNNGART